MRWLNRFALRLRSLFRRSRVERDLDAELRFHLDQEITQHVAAGMRFDDARALAARSIGSLTRAKEQCRDSLGLRLVDEVRQDARQAARALVKNPGFTFVAVLTLALGIGANTAIFSIINSLLLRALPVRDPRQLVVMTDDSNAPLGVAQSWSYAVWDSIRQRSQDFDGVCAWASLRFNLSQGGEMDPIGGLFVSGEFFTTLGVSPLMGRAFTPADDTRGGGPDGPVAVISYDFWQRRFGGSADIVGAHLLVEQVPFTVIAVMPPEFFGTEVGKAFDLAVPIGTEPLMRGKDTALDRRTTTWLNVILRLRRGQSLEAAARTLRADQGRIRIAAMPPALTSRTQQMFLAEPFSLVPATTGTSTLRLRYERPLVTLLVVVTLVLFVACANLANLLLARAAWRRQEFSLRLALGASRWRLGRQLFLESLILAAIGASLGLLVSAWSSRALVAELSTSVTPVFLDLSLDWRVEVFAAAVAIGTALLFGTAPAFRAARQAPLEALKARSAGGSHDARVSNGLVVAQVALSLVLIVVAGLFVQTFTRLAGAPLGFDQERVLVVNVNAMRADVDPDRRLAFYHQLVEAVAAVPGVAHAGGSVVTPISGNGGWNHQVDLPGTAAATNPKQSLVNYVTPGWLESYTTPVRAGRDIDARDTQTSLPVALVNEAFVKRYLEGENPIGRRVSFLAATLDQVRRPMTIVGVVGDAVYQTQRAGFRPTMYVPLAQYDEMSPLTGVSISARASVSSPASLAPAIAAALMFVDRDLTFNFRLLADQVGAALMQDRIVAVLSAFFGVLALLLAALGLYGLTAYAIAQRRTEIGIRMALGGTRARVVWHVLYRALVLIAVGVVVGGVISAWASRLVATSLYGLEPGDPATFMGAAIVLVLTGGLAAWLPAWRGSRVDPMVALRSE